MAPLQQCSVQAFEEDVVTPEIFVMLVDCKVEVDYGNRFQTVLLICDSAHQSGKALQMTRHGFCQHPYKS